MAYVEFMVKKVTHSALTLIAGVLFLAVCFFTLYQNNQTQSEFTSVTQTRQSLIQAKSAVARAKRMTASSSHNSDKYEAAKADLKFNQKRIKQDKNILAQIRQNHWAAAYTVLIKQAKYDLAMNEKDPGTSSELTKAITREILRLQALKDGNFADSPESYPTQMLLFIAQLFQYIIPVLATIITIFILSKVYTDRFVQGVNIFRLIPTKRLSLMGLDIAAGSGVTIVGLVVVIGLIGMVALIFFGAGQFDYPYFSYVPGTEAMKFVPIKKMFLPTILMQLLSIVFVTQVTYAVARCLKNTLPTLLIALTIIVGMSLLTFIIQPLQQIAQFLPTTYLFGLLVSTGEFGVSIQNFSVTANTGYLVLIIANFALLGISTLSDVLQSQNFKKAVL